MSDRVRAKASPFRLAVHDFHVAFRRLPPETSPYEFFKQITAQREGREKQFAKTLGWAVLLLVILAAAGNGPIISVTTALITVEVPKIYLVFLLSVLVFMGLMEFVSAALLQGYQTVAARKFAGRFPNLNAISAPIYGGSGWASVFSARFAFLSPPRIYGLGIFTALFFIFFPVILIYISIYVLEIVLIANYVVWPDQTFMGSIVAVTSAVLLFAPLLLIWFSIHKFPLKKNTKYIRWSFLHQIYRKAASPAYPESWFAP